MNISIEKALTGESSDSILKLIKEKAKYDGDEQNLELTVEDIRRDFFEGDKKANALIAYLDGDPVGLATYGFIYSTFKGKETLWLDDLYINEAYRGKNIGFKFINNLAKIALEKNCGRIDWVVAKNNDIGLGFYQKNNARIIDDLYIGRFDRSKIEVLANE